MPPSWTVANELIIHARVVEQLTRLRLRYVADRLDAVLNDAARTEPTYLDFLDGVLRQEVDAKQRTQVAMGLKIAHSPTVKTLDDFDFKFQPSVDQRLVPLLLGENVDSRCVNAAQRMTV
jgi:DNA replication protein DnaC